MAYPQANGEDIRFIRVTGVGLRTGLLTRMFHNMGVWSQSVPEILDLSSNTASNCTEACIAQPMGASTPLPSWCCSSLHSPPPPESISSHTDSAVISFVLDSLPVAPAATTRSITRGKIQLPGAWVWSVQLEFQRVPVIMPAWPPAWYSHTEYYFNNGKVGNKYFQLCNQPWGTSYNMGDLNSPMGQNLMLFSTNCFALVHGCWRVLERSCSIPVLENLHPVLSISHLLLSLCPP